MLVNQGAMKTRYLQISKSVSEAMSQVNEKTSMALSELKALSSQIANSSSNQPKVSEFWRFFFLN